MSRFETFTVLTKLYFAAMSFCEIKRRLGGSKECETFMMLAHSHFGPKMKWCLEKALRWAEEGWSAGDLSALNHVINSIIDPIDIAGLADDSRGPWRAVEMSDLFIGRNKLNASSEEIRIMLARLGLILPGQPVEIGEAGNRRGL